MHILPLDLFPSYKDGPSIANKQDRIRVRTTMMDGGKWSMLGPISSSELLILPAYAV